jgi:sterol 3beta-glucosyltransferase
VNITLLTIGTRGDVQPFVALGVGLRRAGHKVTLATGKGFEVFVTQHELCHATLDVDLLEHLQSPDGKAVISGKGLLGTVKKAASMYRRVFDQEWAASQGADAVVYHPKALGGYHIAEALNVPGFLAHPVPMFSRTRAFPDPVLPVADLGGSLNKMSYGVFLRLMTAPFHRTINRWRKETLGLSPQRLQASEQLIGGRGCELLYLPPYSPDLNPIEEAFSKIKGLLRKAEARSREALLESIGAAIWALSAEDARGYLDHCGYRTSVQSLW